MDTIRGISVSKATALLVQRDDYKLLGKSVEQVDHPDYVTFGITYKQLRILLEHYKSKFELASPYADIRDCFDFDADISLIELLLTTYPVSTTKLFSLAIIHKPVRFDVLHYLISSTMYDALDCLANIFEHQEPDALLDLTIAICRKDTFKKNIKTTYHLICKSFYGMVNMIRLICRNSVKTIKFLFNEMSLDGIQQIVTPSYIFRAINSNSLETAYFLLDHLPLNDKSVILNIDGKTYIKGGFKQESVDLLVQLLVDKRLCIGKAYVPTVIFIAIAGDNRYFFDKLCDLGMVNQLVFDCALYDGYWIDLNPEMEDEKHQELIAKYSELVTQYCSK